MWIPMFIFDLLVFVAPIIAIPARLARQYVTGRTEILINVIE